MGTPRQQRVAAAILLSTLGVCALFVAQGATNLAGSALIDSAPVVGDAERAQLAATGSGATGSAARVNDERVKLMLSGPPAPPEEVDGGVEDGSVPLEDGPLGPCDGQASLTAVMVSNAREWSLAAITVGGSSRLYREGSVVDGKTVEMIEPHRAIMIFGVRRCYLAMFDAAAPRPAAAATPTATAPTATPSTPATTASTGGLSNEAMDEGITRQSDRNFTVQRGFLETIMQNQAEIMRTARVIPHEENGRTVGVKMYGIRRNSLLGRLGVQNGDMLRTINGFDLTTPDSALEAYTRLSGADSLTLSVVRRGQPVTIDYNIQ